MIGINQAHDPEFADCQLAWVTFAANTYFDLCSQQLFWLTIWQIQPSILATVVQNQKDTQ